MKQRSKQDLKATPVEAPNQRLSEGRWLACRAYETGQDSWQFTPPPLWKCLSRLVCEPATYNVVHTCLASLCVTVYAGVWVQGPLCEYSFLPTLPPEMEPYPQWPQLKCLPNTLITSGYILPLPLIRFISKLSSFKSLSVCWICYLFTARGRSSSSR